MGDTRLPLSDLDDAAANAARELRLCASGQPRDRAATGLVAKRLERAIEADRQRRAEIVLLQFEPGTGDKLATAAADFSAIELVRRDAGVQGALYRFAHESGSSDGVVKAVLDSIRYWTRDAALSAAIHALRSYEFGNAAPDLARNVADSCERARRPAAPLPREAP